MQWLLLTALLLAPLGAPAEQAGLCAPPIPVYPGAQPMGTRLPPGSPGWVSDTGTTLYATPDSLLNIQRFYFTQMLNLGWQQVEQLPGQDIEAFGNEHSVRIDGPVGVLEFRRNGNREHVRITGEAGGYSVALWCNA
jgi:hypothetical protein